ncbi:unnamed protein product, partial [Prorocentrum cordatum]
RLTLAPPVHVKFSNMLKSVTAFLMKVASLNCYNHDKNRKGKMIQPPPLDASDDDDEDSLYMAMMDTVVRRLACMIEMCLLDFWALLLSMAPLRALPLLIALSLRFCRRLSTLLEYSQYSRLPQGFCLMSVALLRVLPLLTPFLLRFFLHQTRLLTYPAELPYPVDGAE